MPPNAADITAYVDKTRAELLTLSAHLGGALYGDTSGQDGVVFEYLFAGGYWFCGVDVARVDEVVVNSGAAI